MSSVSLNDYQEVVAELAEQIRKYGEARSAHDKSAVALDELATGFTTSASALQLEISNSVNALNGANAAVAASNSRIASLQESVERSVVVNAEALDRHTARVDERQEAAETKIRDLSSRLDVLNARVSQVLFWLYGAVALLGLVLLMVILK